MSVQAANDFINKANSDKSIRKEVGTNFEHLVDIGRKHGFSFDHNDLAQAFHQRKGGKDPDVVICQCCFDCCIDDNKG